jgi:hypothetical protein
MRRSDAMKTPRIVRNKIAFAGLVVILLYIVMSIISLFWLPFDPVEMNSAEIQGISLAPMSSEGIFSRES